MVKGGNRGMCVMTRGRSLLLLARMFSKGQGAAEQKEVAFLRDDGAECKCASQQVLAAER